MSVTSASVEIAALLEVPRSREPLSTAIRDPHAFWGLIPSFLEFRSQSAHQIAASI